jgi:hypothetical protein
MTKHLKKEKMKISKYLLALAIAGACSATLSASTLSFYVMESGGNVTLTVGGSLSSLSGWTYQGTGTSGGLANRSGPWINAYYGNIQSKGDAQYDYYTRAPIGPISFGMGVNDGTFVSGASVGFSPGGNPNLLPGDAPSTVAARLYIPHNYILGDSINSSSVFTGETLSSLGLTHDTHYNWSYGNGDQIQIHVGVIPEPSAFALLGLGTVGLVARRRRTA